ncbi:MAG: hypothetical protein EOO47_02550 [Flavobacterium sp.]|nr:MAG: hypothetical protein EOO47_02550 [Flavobacterium sp.]
MHLKLHPILICRSPAFSTDAELASSFESLKEKIELASPSFYSLIENLSHADLPSLAQKPNFTLWKYFNRAKFRATPYGMFAGISILPVGKNLKHAVVTSDLKSIAYADWSHKNALLEKVEASDAYWYCSNSSFYVVSEEIRYICYQNERFELNSVASLPELVAILMCCKNKTPLSIVIQLMHLSFDLDEKSTINLLTQLLQLQLLHCELQANITGEDYFERMNYAVESSPADYVLAHRPLISGGLDGDLLQHLPEWLQFIGKHLKPSQNEDLQYFKRQFNTRFDQQEVSLAVAMDPEIGIGYGDLAQQLNGHELIASIKEQQLRKPDHNIAYGALQQFLLNQMMRGNELKLELFEEEENVAAVNFPNTLSVLFELYQGNPVLYSAGGSTANALLGRFSLIKDSFAAHCRLLAKLEQEANPDVAFFDIAYQAEQKVDNVNRRRHIYDHELAILTWSEQPLTLDFEDIMVSVHRNEVMLRSKKLGKRIIPRLATAYNYNRSDLAAFRFLCDLQHQHLSTSLNLNLRSLFPDLDFYPRASFKGMIVSPAAWRFNKRNIEQLRQQKDGLAYLQKWLAERNMQGYFKAGAGDQTLMFDSQNESDLLAFIQYAKLQPTAFHLSEGLCEPTGLLQDENGLNYHAQYIASYYHSEPIYKSISARDKAKTRIESPGGEWLYFEIYAHPNQTNHLLQKLHRLLFKAKRRQLKSWFFIRYFDPKPHLRIRLQLRNHIDGFEMLRLLKEILASELASLVVNDIQVKTYYKEQERYGVKRMPLVEQFFSADSETVLKLLRADPAVEILLQKSLQQMLAMVQLAFPLAELQLNFSKKMASSFAKEIHLDQALFKQLNASYKTFDLHSLSKLATKSAYFKLLNQILASCDHTSEKVQLTADLIHMHVNRVFKADRVGRGDL